MTPRKKKQAMKMYLFELIKKGCRRPSGYSLGVIDESEEMAREALEMTQVCGVGTRYRLGDCEVRPA